VIKQLDRYRKHCLWRGADLLSKKPSKAAWPMVCVPKKQGGLGVLDLYTHNEAMLMKFLHKFYSKADIPWINLVWAQYYSRDKLPGQHKKGSFWWRDIVSLLPKFKGLAMLTVADGSMVLLWKDQWNGLRPEVAYPELFSFANNQFVTFKAALSRDNLLQNFNLPLSAEAYHQFLELQQSITGRTVIGENDQWRYSWGNASFSTSKAYKHLKGGNLAHPVYHWIWRSKCQMKHKVFFWLLLKDRLSTRDLLRRKDMNLDSFTCDLCILQRLESGAHLFLRCNFARACWNSLGVIFVSTRPVIQIFRQIRDKLEVPFAMEIIILMAWAIWVTRNDWIFNNINPTVESCRRKFKEEFKLLLLRAKPSLVEAMSAWLDNFF
jgi:hypothetical protein